MPTDTWGSVALPSLRFISDHEGDDFVSIGDLADAIGIDPQTVAREMDRLAGAGYVQEGVTKTMTGGDARPWFFLPLLTERGARTVGMWPSGDPFADLVTAVERRIADESQPEERSKLQKLRSSIVDVGKGVAVGILIDVAHRGGL